MNTLATSAIALICVFGGALLGFWLRAVLPEDHLSPTSRDLVKLGMGTIATMTALVLGLLVARQRTPMTRRAANSLSCPPKLSYSVASSRITDPTPRRFGIN